MKLSPKKLVVMTLTVAVLGGVGFAVTDYWLNSWRMAQLPKNFYTVRAGVLYRSGQMTPRHFENVVRKHNIRTVVALNPHGVPYEKPTCEQLGVNYVTFEMPGSGQGNPKYFHEFLRLMGDETNHPILVHCAAGAYRTGASVALYRMLYEGWSLDDAAKEMKYSGYAGQQDLIDHIRKTFDRIPKSMIREVCPPTESAQATKPLASKPAPSRR